VDVYLVRHAIAEQRDAMRWPVDSLRPLTPEGADRFRRAARGLHRLVPTVDRLLTSPYARAWQTAELLHDEIDWPAPLESSGLSGHSTTVEALDALRVHADRDSVALVGHEPQLSWLASLLLAGEESVVRLELKKGAVALLELTPPPTPGSAVLRWSVRPKILRGLA
jgi:phosphohistidine phosphatase